MLQIRRFRPLLLSLLAVSAACGDSTLSNPGIEGPGNYARYVSSGGRNRSYELHVPTGWTRAARMPVVLVFHGVPGTPQFMRDVTEMNALADQRGFLVAYPAAATGDWDLGCGGCTAAEAQGVDVARFVRALADQLVAEAGASATEVYAAGFSQGALAVHHLACALPDRIAAFASVGATMLQRPASECDPGRPVPALFVHGTADAVFPAGGTTSNGVTSLPIAASVQLWLDHNDCTGAGTSTDLPDLPADGVTVTRITYAGCPSAGEVVFYRVNGGGHTWPGAPAGSFSSQLGPVSQDIEASAVIADFFARH